MNNPVAKSFLFLVFALLLSSRAEAAEVFANFGPGGSCAVTFYGEIKPGDESIFDALTPDCRGGGVLLKSDGGSLVAGLRIGELIREKGLETAVAFDARCASACALAWLGGTKRYMSTSSWIGFHAAYTVDDLGTANESGIGNALVGAYMTTLGLPKSAVIFAASARPNEMNWLTSAHALQLGIDVVVLSKADYAWIEALDQSDPHRDD
ncbi:hypothetical protein HR059_07455 [Sinorhizobium meliloti WSM1022]|uniref:COG3904 family protein n=1 Tax=Rhizobium meliloti TaxID=382 RepID=UPI00040120C0|nr:hypothetical protein [Sinorhizobium meliloti]QKN14308.1 hypothetical protein HR059_07455 [Sinorhizobium meliloti WSM1022]